MLGSPEVEAETGMPVLVIFERVLPGERGEGSRLGEKKEPINRRGGSGWRRASAWSPGSCGARITQQNGSHLETKGQFFVLPYKSVLGSEPPLEVGPKRLASAFGVVSSSRKQYSGGSSSCGLAQPALQQVGQGHAKPEEGTLLEHPQQELQGGMQVGKREKE